MRKVYLPARIFSTALATMKFLSETSPWIGFSSRLGTAGFGTVARVIFATILQGTGALGTMLKYVKLAEMVWLK